MAERGRGMRAQAVDEEDSTSYIWFTLSCFLHEELFGTVHRRLAERGRIAVVSCGGMNNGRLDTSKPPPDPLAGLAVIAGPSRGEKLQDLRAVVMTKRNKRAQATIPHQVRRNLSCSAWFSSPRRTTCFIELRRERIQRRISHGIARSVEGLRKLRLPLVPATSLWKCLLQRMPGETKRVPLTG